MENPSVKGLLEAGAHFGHHTGYWHPRMKRYIFAQRNGIHIIDLEQTVQMLQAACTFVRDVAASGKSVLFVGTKRQAQQVIEEEAKRCSMFFVSQRWLGGMLTNFGNIQARIDYLVRLEDRKEKGELDLLSKKERSRLEKKLVHLNNSLGGFKEMTSFPGVLFIADPLKDKIALAEARRVGIPVVAISDTNCNPDTIDHPIPANDDAIKAIRLIASKISDAVIEGRGMFASEQVDETSASTGAHPEEPIEMLRSYTFNPDEA
ncbi:MAG: 30S ribosomal protein S2 [Dehalococcoidia bacterium]|jgi:small subunit ribosomal protein S2|nr:30S ribosomal protein S2 [Dehalococcoidia bacterium]